MKALERHGWTRGRGATKLDIDNLQLLCCSAGVKVSQAIGLRDQTLSLDPSLLLTVGVFVED